MDTSPWFLPTVTPLGGEYFSFDWPSVCRITVDRIYEDKHATHCELSATCRLPGLESHIHRASFNLTSTTARKTLCSALHDRQDAIDWPIYIEYVCATVLTQRREGSPAIEISNIELPEGGRPYRIYPLVPDNVRTIFYGDGGTSKSYLALLLALACAMPEAKCWAPLGFTPAPNYVQTLYLDYETDQWEVRNRTERLTRGLALPMATAGMSIHYQERSQAIADSVPEIRRKLVECQADQLIIDSLGAACGGNPNDPEVALRLMNALRGLGKTAILIDHIGKNTDDKARAKGPFGSVYKWNLARSVWEVRRAQESGKDEIKASIIHRKANNSRLFGRLGLRWSFDDTTTWVEPTDTSQVAELARDLPLRDQIIGYLRREGASDYGMIAEALSATEGTVKKTLSQLKGKGAVMNRDTKWGLVDNTHVQ